MGAITELVGPPCSGRTTLAFALLAEMTAAGKAVAWIDVSDTLDPESAAAAGVDLSRQLWVRCGAAPAHASSPVTDASPVPPVGYGPPLLVEGNPTPAPSGGGGSPHPRAEARGLSHAIDAFLKADTFARTSTPRGPELNHPSTHRNRIVGTPGAPNRKLTPAANKPMSSRVRDREEQPPTDRLPPRRGYHLHPSQRDPKHLAAAQIAYTGQLAGAWNDNRRNAAIAAVPTVPNAIATGLPRFRDMEARAAGQGHGLERGPFEWKPSTAHLRTGQNSHAGTAASATFSSSEACPVTASLAGEPPRLFGKSSPVWKTLDQALRATDLLLSAGGFSALVLDLGSTAPEFAWRIPLATWFRFRSAAERARTVLLLITQHPCARSSAELVLRLSPAQSQTAGTVLTGVGFGVTIDRQRFEPQAPSSTHQGQPGNLHLVTARKPPQRDCDATWQCSAAWVNVR